MSKTLEAGIARVYAHIGINPDKAGGQYGQSQVIVAINTAQRFVVKSAIPKSLGALARRSVHTVGAGTPTSFNKGGLGEGRTLFLAKGTAMTEDIAVLTWYEWMQQAKFDGLSGGNLQTYWAMEMGVKVYLRPILTASMAVTEFWVADPDDMEDAADTYSMPDDWFEWINMNAAQILLAAGDRPEKMTALKNLMVGWSAQFRTQYGANPPDVLAPAPAGDVE